MRWAKVARVRLQGVGVSITVPLLEQWEPLGFRSSGRAQSDSWFKSFRLPCREAIWRHGLRQQAGEKGTVVAREGDLVWLSVGPWRWQLWLEWKHVLERVSSG